MGMSVSDLTPVATRPVKTRFRRIATPIPVPQSIDLIRRLREVEPRSMAGMVPIVWHRAQGFQVRDPYGNQWIDLSSGIVMANSGHAHPRILEAIRRQTDSPLLFTYAYPGRSPAAAAGAPGQAGASRAGQGHPVFIGNRSQRVRHHADAAARPANLAS